MNIYVIAGIVAVALLLLVAVIVIKSLAQGGSVEEKLPFRLKKFFFSRSEQQFLTILEEQIDHLQFTVFPKVRLGDFIETTAYGAERQGSWNKIRSKHIDFLVYDTKKGAVVLAIELDGNSHSSERMQKSDDFKNRLYPAIGLELVRIRVGSDFATEIAGIVQKLGQIKAN